MALHRMHLRDPARASGKQDASRRSMLLIIAIVLAIAWLLGFTVFHVSAFAIHLLLVLALVAIIVHFARGRAPWVPN